MFRYPYTSNIKSAIRSASSLKWNAVKSAVICFISIIVLTGAINKPAGDNYKMHCLYIYKFTQLTKWPSEKKSSSLVIGFAGPSPLISVFQKYITEKNKSGSVKISVVQYASAQETMNCDVLYITKEESKNISTYVQQINDKPVLLVTEQEGLIKAGSCINLIYNEGSSIEVQLNKAAFSDHKLKTTPDLIKLANEVVSI